MVYNEPNHVTLSFDQKSVLISYGRVVSAPTDFLCCRIFSLTVVWLCQAPPQLWQISGNQDSTGITLVLKNTFVCRSRSGRFVRLPAAFGGPDESFVLRACAGRSAKIQNQTKADGTAEKGAVESTGDLEAHDTLGLKEVVNLSK